MGRGCFWGSGVKDVYAQPLTPPSVSDYLFGSNPTIHVYASALEAYQNSRWAEYGTIVGDLTYDIIVGIEEVRNEKLKVKNDEAIYDLSGRKINSSMFNGQSSMLNGLRSGNIYIKNGKKILFGKH